MRTHHIMGTVHRALTVSTLVLVAACSGGGHVGQPADDQSSGGQPGPEPGPGPGPGGGGGAGGSSGDGPAPPTDQDYIYPDSIHTGFDGTHPYKVPVATNLSGADVKWVSADPSIVTLDPVAIPADWPFFTDKSMVMLTAKKAGTTKVTVTQGTKTFSADVTVKAYTVDQYNVGKDRYTTSGTGFGQTACAMCHAGADGPDHSPTTVAEYDDDATLQAITTAAYPDGYKLSLPSHKWELTDAQRVGIMAYLRALPPKGF